MMQRHEDDTDALVNHHYSFLEDHVSGNTLPRTQFRMGVWNDGHTNSARNRSKINYWEPRIKSVRDIGRSSESLNQPRRNEPSDRQKNLPDIIPEKLSTENPSQQLRHNNSSESANNQYPQESSLLQWTNKSLKGAEVQGWKGGAQNWSDQERETSLHRENAEKISSPQKGSFLLQRTNEYMEAAEKLRRRKEMTDSVVTSNHESSSYLNSQNGKEVLEFNSNKKTDSEIQKNLEDKDRKQKNRSSVLERVEELNQKVTPTPPPPPPLPVENQTVLNKVQAHWLNDVKTGRKNLKPSQTEPAGLRRVVDPEPTNVPFKEKLNRILQGQVAAQRWQEIGSGDTRGPSDTPNFEETLPTRNYKTIKTLSKAAMKDRLEEILVKGPPSRPSFHGAFDMDEKRKETVARLRNIEAQAVRKDIESDEEDNSDTPLKFFEIRNVFENTGNPPKRHSKKDDVAARQRHLMTNVVSTIKLKGKLQEKLGADRKEI